MKNIKCLKLDKNEVGYNSEIVRILQNELNQEIEELYMDNC